MLRGHVISAVFKRNLSSYFFGLLGYLFIVVFVVLAALLAFDTQFFTNNLANLDRLSESFPLLLLFIIPAITMSVWADEKKLGTDELLFTLPASDVEILLGKYLAVLTVYTVTLLFSVTQLFVLAWIGNPDLGMIFTTYLGYWAAGAALLSAGMFASVLTSSTTVAFVLGAVICSVPVFIGNLAPRSDFIQNLSLPMQLRDFSMGILPLSGLLYFLSLTILMLYLNLVFISRRHWSSGREGTGMGLQFGVRTVSLAAILISLNVIVSQASPFAVRRDMTAEKLFSLSPTTRTLIDRIGQDSPITIQAYLSPEVPREYVPIRKRLIGLLRQYDRMAGNRIEVRFVDVHPFSEQSEEARHFGIEPRQVQSERGGRTFIEDVYLGAVITSPYDEVVVPFFDVGTPLEYELTRSVRTVSQEDRLTVGILNTDARLMGGFDMSSFRSQPPWRIVEELRKQYQVESVSPDSPIDETKYDVLLAVLPSSLTQPQMANFVDYVVSGKPVLIFDDPLPVFDGGRGLQHAPRMPKPRQGGMFGQGPPPEQKADDGMATSLLSVLEIAWDNGQVVFDRTAERLHPEFGDLFQNQPELVFISPRSGVSSAFSPNSEITSGLQELLTFFPGAVRPRAGSGLKFEPLLRTGLDSGLLDWDQVTRPGMFGGVELRRDRQHIEDEDAHVLATHIQSPGAGGVNAIFVADADMISNELFNIREREAFGLKIDNVTFLLNAVDVLAGDDSYLDLRKRRPEHRTLLKVEQQTADFIKQRNEERQKADEAAKTQLEQARENFRKQQERIRNDDSLDERAKSIQLRIAQETEQRRLEVTEEKINRAKQQKIDGIKSSTERQIYTIEREFRLWAVVLPPLPAVLLGLAVLSMRLYSERRDILPSRRRA